MKQMRYIFAVVMLTGLAGTSLADCPSTLTAEQMVDCIVKENAGYVYPLRGKTVSPATTTSDDPSSATSNSEEAPLVAADAKTPPK